jgi:hypothetical protein
MVALRVEPHPLAPSPMRKGLRMHLQILLVMWPISLSTQRLAC